MGWFAIVRDQGLNISNSVGAADDALMASGRDLLPIVKQETFASANRRPYSIFAAIQIFNFSSCRFNLLPPTSPIPICPPLHYFLPRLSTPRLDQSFPTFETLWSRIDTHPPPTHPPSIKVRDSIRDPLFIGQPTRYWVMILFFINTHNIYQYY